MFKYTIGTAVAIVTLVGSIFTLGFCSGMTYEEGFEARQKIKEMENSKTED